MAIKVCVFTQPGKLAFVDNEGHSNPWRQGGRPAGSVAFAAVTIRRAHSIPRWPRCQNRLEGGTRAPLLRPRLRISSHIRRRVDRLSCTRLTLRWQILLPIFPVCYSLSSCITVPQDGQVTVTIIPIFHGMILFGSSSPVILPHSLQRIARQTLGLHRQRFTFLASCAIVRIP